MSNYRVTLNGQELTINSDQAKRLVGAGRVKMQDLQVVDTVLPQSTGRTAGPTPAPAQKSWLDDMPSALGIMSKAGEAVRDLPKKAYDAARTGIAVPVSAAAATGKQLARAVSGALPYQSILGLPIAEEGDKTWAQDWRESMANRDKGAMGLATDPLMYVPMGRLATPAAKLASKVPGVGGLAAKVLGGIGEGTRVVTASPAEIGEGVAAALKGARRASMAKLEAQAAKAEAERALSTPAVMWEARMLDPMHTTAQLDKQLQALDAIDKMSTLPRAVAKGVTKAADKAPLGDWIAQRYITPNTIGAARNIATGASAGAQGAVIGSLERGLNADEQKLSNYKPTLGDFAIGALLGGSGGDLQRRGMENYPSMHSTMTNRALDPEARKLLRGELRDILDRGVLPKGKHGLSELAEHEMEKLGSGAYNKATEAVSGTNAAFMPGGPGRVPLKQAENEAAFDVLENTGLDFGSMIADNRASAERTRLGMGQERPWSSMERAMTIRDVKNAMIKTGLDKHKNAKDLEDILLQGLKESKNPREFQENVIGGIGAGVAPGSSAIEKWLNQPHHSVSSSELRKDVEARVRKQLLDPKSDIRMVAGPGGAGDAVIPSQVQSELDDKFAALLSAAKAAGQDPERMSAEFASQNRTSLTNPKVYANTTANAAEYKARLATNEALHDAINDALERLPGYKDVLGDAPYNYKKWRTLLTLAEHPGNTGLASRLPWGEAVRDPFLGPALQYKTGRALERSIPVLEITKSKAKSDTTKSKKER